MPIEDRDQEVAYDFNSMRGIPFRAVFEPAKPDAKDYQKPGTVAFYDRRYEFTPDGQFTGARYYISDLLNKDDLDHAYGLDLHGGVDDWTLGAWEYAGVIEWLEKL